MIDKNLLARLNTAVEATEQPLEGNVFYFHHHVPDSYELFEPFAVKRQFLIDLAKRFCKITEIGFNAGHSAALMLSANDQLTLTSVDIGYHAYVVPCGDILREVFPQRFDLLIKDSANLLAQDLFGTQAVIIDGNHSYQSCAKDLELSLQYCAPGTVIVLDDFDMPSIQQALLTVRSRLELYQEIAHDPILQGVFCIK
jgi:predicted O-methyltransferase YrrM